MDFKTWLVAEESEALLQLITLAEDDIYAAWRAKQLRQTLKQGGMPKRKRNHSERVTQGVHSLFTTRDAPLDMNQWTTVTAALFHDYLERGGDHTVLTKLGVTPETIQVINALTSDKNDNDPLEHLQGVLPTLDSNLKNMVILIKLSDRLDNLSQRADRGGIGRQYMNKSNELVKWLFQQYTGNPFYIMILRNRLRELGVKARKKYLQTVPPGTVQPQ